MTRTAHRLCPLCGYREVRVLHAMRFAMAAESPLPPAYDVAACARCEFVYADTPGSVEAYERHYAEHSRYEDPAVATGGGDAPADRRRLAEVADWIAARLPTDAGVLDIGCANGGLLKALRKRGFGNLAGVDPAAGCVARLRSQGMQAWQGTLTRLPAEAAGFDLIILSHVLEHVLNAGEALRAVRARLAAGGHLYLETPDASRYSDRPFVPFYFFDSEHINHFDGASLVALGGRCGYARAERDDSEIELENGFAYPVARVLLKMWAPQGAKTAALDAEPTTLTILREAVEDYIAESRRRAQDPALDAIADGTAPLVLWGAGSYAQRLLAGSPLSRAKFVAVIDRDRNKQGLHFAGCEVTAPETGLRGLPNGAVVIVAAALASEAISAECRRLGIACHVPAGAS